MMNNERRMPTMPVPLNRMQNHQQDQETTGSTSLSQMPKSARVSASKETDGEVSEQIQKIGGVPQRQKSQLNINI